MPSNVINLNEVIPGMNPTTFVLDGKEYTVPGDLPTETVFEFLALFEDITRFQEESKKLRETTGDEVTSDLIGQITKQTADMTAKINAALLKVFQQGDPDLEELPFGAKASAFVLGEVLAILGLAVPDQAVLPVPPPVTPQDRKRKAAPKSRTTKRTTTTGTRKATQQSS